MLTQVLQRPAYPCSSACTAVSPASPTASQLNEVLAELEHGCKGVLNYVRVGTYMEYQFLRGSPFDGIVSRVESDIIITLQRSMDSRHAVSDQDWFGPDTGSVKSRSK